MFRIAFDFDEVDKIVSNFRIVEFEKPKEDKIYHCDVLLEDNVLTLFPPAVQKMNLRPGDRISIQYISEGIGKSSPVIGRADVFTDAFDGNRVSAKYTVSFKGQKNDTLKQFGHKFDLEPYKEGMWKLIKAVKRVNPQETIIDDENDLENLNPNELDTELNEIFNTIN